MEHMYVKEEVNNSSSDEDMDYYSDGFENYSNSYDYNKENVEIKQELTINQELSLDCPNAGEVAGNSRNSLLLSDSAGFLANQTVTAGEFLKVSDLLLNCDICLERRFTKHGLMKHRFAHTLDTHYTCLICFKTIAYKCSLISHLQRHSNKYICQVCSKCFNCPSNLNRHKRIHSNEKRYKCNVCKKCFGQNNYLVIHKRTHTGERPFPCDVCHTRFRSKSLMRQHKIAQHPLNKLSRQKKSFECDVCQKLFRYNNSMLRHKQYNHLENLGHVCKICDKTFIRPDYLKTHLRIHSNKKEFDCETCQKSFQYKSTMKQHKRRYNH